MRTADDVPIETESFHCLYMSCHPITKQKEKIAILDNNYIIQCSFLNVSLFLTISSNVTG